MSRAQQIESTRTNDFQITSHGRPASIRIDVVGTVDTEFPPPTVDANLELETEDQLKIVSEAAELLHVELAVPGGVVKRRYGDVGVIVGVRKAPSESGPTVEQVHAILEPEHLRDTNNKHHALPRDFIVADSGIVTIGTRKYSYFKIGADDASQFLKIYSVPLMDGYYAQFFFHFVSNDVGESTKVSEKARLMIDEMMQSVSIQVSDAAK